MFKHLDSQQTDQVKDAMFLVEHEPDDVVIREGMSQYVGGIPNSEGSLEKGPFAYSNPA